MRFFWGNFLLSIVQKKTPMKYVYGKQRKERRFLGVDSIELGTCRATAGMSSVSVVLLQVLIYSGSPWQQRGVCLLPCLMSPWQGTAESMSRPSKGTEPWAWAEGNAHMLSKEQPSVKTCSRLTTFSSRIEWFQYLLGYWLTLWLLQKVTEHDILILAGPFTRAQGR